MADKSKNWKKFDNPPVRLEGWEKCYYARERIARGGFKASDANQLIDNFKIKPEHKSNQFRWKHKVNACNQFAEELARFLPKGVAVMAIPPHAKRGDADYDPRFDMVFARLRQLRPDLTFVEPISRSKTVAAVHTVEKRPKAAEIQCSLQFVGFDDDEPPDNLVIIDDVVTGGTHFSVCRRMILDECPNTEVHGVFWAKTVWEDDFDEFDGE